MFTICLDEKLLNSLINTGCELVQTKSDVKGKKFWVLREPETFSFDFTEEEKGKFFRVDNIRFDF